MNDILTPEQADCYGQMFGHLYTNAGVCLKCRGFQKPLKQMALIERKWKENKSGSARAYLISQFLEEINKGRDGVKYKKLTSGFLAFKLSHIKKMEDLRWFWDSCHKEEKGKKVFKPEIFWWKLKN